MKYLITFFLSVLAVSGATFEPDMEVKIKGLVCPSCAIGIKRNFLKHKPQVNAVKFDTRKQVALVDFFENENKRIYWLKNEQIIKLVKDAGYEVTYIKRLDNSKPNRYNAP
tara:strand:- start:571 stop:903 length:333 start_codon:yes stop_codon:yes gene_type:complete